MGVQLGSSSDDDRARATTPSIAVPNTHPYNRAVLPPGRSRLTALLEEDPMTARKFFRSRAWRALRWAGLAAAVPALWACNARSLEAPMVKPNSTFQNNFQE